MQSTCNPRANDESGQCGNSKTSKPWLSSREVWSVLGLGFWLQSLSLSLCLQCVWFGFDSARGADTNLTLFLSAPSQLLFFPLASLSFSLLYLSLKFQFLFMHFLISLSLSLFLVVSLSGSASVFIRNKHERESLLSFLRFLSRPGKLYLSILYCFVFKYILICYSSLDLSLHLAVVCGFFLFLSAAYLNCVWCGFLFLISAFSAHILNWVFFVFS